MIISGFMLFIFICTSLWMMFWNFIFLSKLKQTQKELAKAREDLCKLKLMNKLCHDWDGNLIKGRDYRDNV